MKLGTPTRIEIKPTKEKTGFRFLLTFPGRLQPVEFETSAAGAMMIMAGLQRLQTLHKIPIPRAVRPRGKPHLHVVMPDE